MLSSICFYPIFTHFAHLLSLVRFFVATPVQAFINHQFGVAHSWKTAPPSARSELWLRGWRVLSPSRLLPPYGAAAWAWVLLSYPRHPWTDRWAASQRRTVLASSLLGCGISDTWHGARHRVWFEARATRCNNVWGCCPNGQMDWWWLLICGAGAKINLVKLTWFICTNWREMEFKRVRCHNWEAYWCLQIVLFCTL